MSYEFLVDIALILMTTKAFGIVAKRFKMPQVVGAIIAGVVFGPAGLNVLHSTEFLSNLAELGVIVIMFSAGLETDLVELKRVGKSGFLVALLGVLVPLGGGYLFGMFYNQSADAAAAMLENLFLGVILTATSVSITVETLKEMGKLNTKTGNTILAAALIDDILGLICLAVVNSIATGSSSGIGLVFIKILLFIVAAVVVGILVNKLIEWYSKNKDGANMRRFPVLAFVFCLLMSFSAEHFFGVSAIIGAFIAGVSLSSTHPASYIESRFNSLSFLFLTPIFFANIGIDMELGSMDLGLIIATIILIIIAVVTKLVGCGIGAKLSRLTTKESIQVGVGMTSRGEVALIVASNGLALGVLQPVFFSMMVIMVIVTAILTPILLKVAYRSENKYTNLQESGLVNRREMIEQLDAVSQQLLQNEHKRIKSEREQEKNDREQEKK